MSISPGTTPVISSRIADAYKRDLEKPALKAFKLASRHSRKFGFPIVCSLQGSSESEQTHWAACLLLQIAETWPIDVIPKDLELIPGTALYLDAKQLVSNGLASAHHLTIDSGHKDA